MAAAFPRVMLRALLVLLLVLPGAARAAAPWGVPETAAQPGGMSALAPGLVLAPQGGLLAFSLTAPDPLLDDVGRGRVFGLGATGLEGPQDLPVGTEVVGVPQAYGRASTLVLTRRRTGGVGKGRAEIGVRSGSTASPSASSEVLDRGVRIDDDGDEVDPVIAVNLRGAAVAAWVAYLGEGRTQLRVALRPAGGRFGRPSVLVGRGFVQSPAVAIDSSGSVTVAYAQNAVPGRPRVQARVRLHDRAFGPVQDLGPSLGVVRVAVGMGSTDRTVVAWQTFDAGEETNGPTRTYGAVQRSGPHRFAPAVTLDPGEAPGGVTAALAVAVSPDGKATVAWTARRGTFADGVYAVRTAEVDADARFRPARDLAGGAGAVRALAVASDGSAALAFSAPVSDDAPTGALVVAVRPSGGAFGVPELVSAANDRVAAAAVAIRSGEGGAVAAWLARAGELRNVVRVARRG